MNDSDLAIVIPLWRRTTHIERVYDSARAATPNARVLFVVSEGDERIVNASVGFGEQLVVPGDGGGQGDYARKINLGYRATTEPLIFTAADDLDFHPGWFKAASVLVDVQACKPSRVLDRQQAIGVVGTVDLCNGRTMRGEHSTHSLVARWYADCCAVADQPGAIYAEVYGHEWCDDELVATARHNGAYAHARDAIVEHLHWLVDKSPMDETYEKGMSQSRRSRATFISRRRLWGGSMYAGRPVRRRG